VALHLLFSLFSIVGIVSCYRFVTLQGAAGPAEFSLPLAVTP
jgi:hypothetical protein